MEIILCPKEWTKERSFVHSFVKDGSEEELVHGDDLFVPSTGPILCAKEFADEYSLMHYRRGGEKKGIRRWQNEDGSYTSAGREHYAEMYGWGKIRADRAQAKSDKYARKAERAKAELDKRQVKSDRAHVKLDRKGTDTAAEKSKLADSRLNEAKLRYDTYSMKANKYQDKSDKLHDKWDKKTRELENQARNMRKDEATFHYLGQLNDDQEYRDREKQAAARAGKLESELVKRGIQPKADTSSESVQRDEQNAVDEKFKNDRFAEGSKAFKENTEFMKKVDRFDKLDPDERHSVEQEMIKRMDDDLKRSDTYWHDVYNKNGSAEDPYCTDAENEYDRFMDVMRNNYDRLSAQAKKYTVESAINLISGNITSPLLTDIGDSGGKISQWIEERADKLSGNMNGDQWKPGSHGEKAAKDVHAEWDKAEARAKEVGREIGITDEDAWWNPRSKDYEKLQKALANDKLYASIKENSDKREKDLVKAVAQDMGFHITSEILNALEWFVWRD